jgi:hypothetical protein
MQTAAEDVERDSESVRGNDGAEKCAFSQDGVRRHIGQARHTQTGIICTDAWLASSWSTHARRSSIALPLVIESFFANRRRMTTRSAAKIFTSPRVSRGSSCIGAGREGGMYCLTLGGGFSPFLSFGFFWGSGRGRDSLPVTLRACFLRVPDEAEDLPPLGIVFAKQMPKAQWRHGCKGIDSTDKYGCCGCGV